jgi:hypothetical protein
MAKLFVRQASPPVEMSGEEMKSLLSLLHKFEMYAIQTDELTGDGHRILDKCKDIGEMGSE